VPSRPAPEDSLRKAWSYKAPSPPPANLPCAAQRPEDYCYTFTDSGAVAADSLPFAYRWHMGDGTVREGRTVHHCYAAPGRYAVRMEVLDPYSRQVVAVESAHELEVRDLRQVYIDSYDTVDVGQELVLDAFKSDAPGCRIQSVFWQMGDGTTALGPEQRHAYTRRGSYRVQMMLQGIDLTGKPCAVCTFKQVEVVQGYRGATLRDSLRRAEEGSLSARGMAGDPIVLEVVKEGYQKHRDTLQPGIAQGRDSDSVLLRPVVHAATAAVTVRDLETGLPLRGVEVVLRDARSGRDLGTYTLADSVASRSSPSAPTPSSPARRATSRRSPSCPPSPSPTSRCPSHSPCPGRRWARAGC
jgi:hypothetical protein